MDSAATGSHTGLNWQDAYTSLQDALFLAAEGQQIWVAQGTYRPDQGRQPTPGDRGETFQLKSGVAIYGGFPSGGGDWEDRDPHAYEAILSGDLEGNDEQNEDPYALAEDPTRADNSIHVVTGTGTDETAILDGFVVTAGNAYYAYNPLGGGMYNLAGSPTVIACRFVRNSALSGGAVYSELSGSTFIDCEFLENGATAFVHNSKKSGGFGGGVYITGVNATDAAPTLDNCCFLQNRAEAGCGIYNVVAPSVIRGCTFSENSIHDTQEEDSGGGIYSVDAEPYIYGCTFIKNRADLGSGIDYRHTTGDRSFRPVIDHCLFLHNEGVPIWTSNETLPIDSLLTVMNCTCLGNTATNIYGGGALALGPYYAKAEVLNCVFKDNFGWNRYEIILPNWRNHTNYVRVAQSYIQSRESGILVGRSDSIVIWDETNLTEEPILTPDGHLTAASSCRDAVDMDDAQVLLADVDGEAIIAGDGIDIGADEFVDVDDDGLPDWWERLYFSSDEAAEATLDPDHDGLTNIEEYEEYGSHPVRPGVYVCATTGHDNNPGTQSQPFKTIQAGLNVASDGDTVLVLSSETPYTGEGNRHLTFNGRSVVVRGVAGECSSEPPVIVLDGSSSIADVNSLRGAFAALEGFTIEDPCPQQNAILDLHRSRLLIKNCTLRRTSTAHCPGIFNCTQSSPVISGLVLESAGRTDDAPDGGLLSYSNIHVTGNMTIAVERFDIESSCLYGQGSLNIPSDTTVRIVGDRMNAYRPPSIVQTNIHGSGVILIDSGEQLVISDGAEVDLGGGPTDPNSESAGRIIVNGSLVIRDTTRLQNTNIDVNLLEIGGGNDIRYNNILLQETAAGYGGEFFVEGRPTIAYNTITSEGDRYLDMDPDPQASPDERPTITNNTIEVVIKEGKLGAKGTLLELRAADYDFKPSGVHRIMDSKGFTEDPSANWVLERLVIEQNAKLNLTNRQGFEFQDLTRPDIADSETVYVNDLVLYPHAVLNTGLQTLYCRNIILVNSTGQEIQRNPEDLSSITGINGSRIEDIPLLGFSLVAIDMNDDTPSPANEFDIRVRRRLRDPKDILPQVGEPRKEGLIERIDEDSEGPESIPEGHGGVMDMQTCASDKACASSVAAKGAFARACEPEILVEFDYLFKEDPWNEAELVVSLSDDPGVGKGNMEIARIRPPAVGRPGSLGSNVFATFSGTFRRGTLNFTRGTYIEIALHGRDSRCWIDNWDPQIRCSYARRDFGGEGGWGFTNLTDYLLLLSELNTRVTTGKGCLDLVPDGVIRTSDLLAWYAEQVPPSAPVSSLVYSPPPADPNRAFGPVAVFGKPGAVVASTVPEGALYSTHWRGVSLGSRTAPGEGPLVTAADGELYQVDMHRGLIRVGDGSVVASAGSTSSFEGLQVILGLRYDEDVTLLLDAAFDSNEDDIVYVVPVQIRDPRSKDSWVGAARLRLLPTDCKVEQLYSLKGITGQQQSIEFNELLVEQTGIGEPDLEHLQEVEVDEHGNLYMISSVIIPNGSAASANDWLLVFQIQDPNSGQVFSLADQGITAPSNLLVRGDELCLTSSISREDLYTEIYRFALARSGSTVDGLSEPQTSLVKCPFPSICQNQPDLCALHTYVATITGLGCDRQTGTIFGTGLTMPRFAEDAQWTEDIDLHDIYSTPFFFTIGPEDDVTAGPIQATELSDALYPAPPLPISLTWTGQMDALPCAGADLTVDGEVSLPDLVLFASHWLRTDCISWRDCGAANVADGDGRSTVDLGDLAVLARHWLSSSSP